MPPEEAKRHPGTAARDDFLAELENAFTQADNSASLAAPLAGLIV